MVVGEGEKTRKVKITLAVFLGGGVLLSGLLAGYFSSLVFWGLALAAAATFFYFWTKTSFYLLVAYLPFQLALNLTSDVDLLLGRVLILLLLAVWLVKILKNKKAVYLGFPTGLALLTFGLVALASVLVAQNQLWALRKFLVFVSIFPLFFLTVNFIKDLPSLKKLLSVIVGGAVLSALVAIGQFLAQFVFGFEAVIAFWGKNIAPLFFGQTFGQVVMQNPSWLVLIGDQTLLRAIGLFPDPHMLAFYLGLVSPFVLTMAVLSPRWRVWLTIAFCFLVVVLFLTFSRGGYLGLLVSFLVAGFLGWRFFSRETRIFVSGLFLAATVLIFLTGPAVVERFFSVFNLAEGSNVGRLEIWRTSWEQIKSHPILGVGLGNYPLALNFNEPYRSAVTSHNLYLDILAETGLFGLLAWVWFLGGILKEWLVKIKKADNIWRFVGLGVWGAIIYFSVHSFFETAIFNPTVLSFLMIISGLAMAAAKISQAKN